MVSSTLRPLFNPGKDPVPVLQGAGWAPGSVWTGGKSRPLRDSIPDRPARSQSLYRLSYLAHINRIVLYITHGRCLLALTFVFTFPSAFNAMQSIHLRQETFLFLRTFRLALWPIQPPVARVPGFFTEGKAAGA